ncbi:hypothetical protein QQS21_010517 [Conoideocrella luteorostrata]|uniref:F-box domain-containing protein n=1 Tax=Conoideocrella luteorostrata TaxID=1105319 RepID=A0AAJ0CJB6_9HYPO|nr:hypothetical protein QQS21_010517 [Conoideocrella luteorostrata]
MEKLPVELVSGIAGHLVSADLKSFRLSCRQISAITRHLLALQHFNGLPWRPDASRLYELSRIPDCARQIRSIKFNFARLDAYSAIHDSFRHHYLIEPEPRTEIIQERWEPYLQTQRQMRSVGEFRLDLLKEAVARLPALKEVTLTWTQCPWDHGMEAHRFFIPEVSVQLAEEEVNTIQHAVLTDILAAGVQLETLTVEPLRSCGAGKCGSSDDMYRNLRRLDLVLDRTYDGPILYDVTRAPLLSSSSLKELRLEFLSWDRVYSEPQFMHPVALKNLEVLELIRPEIGLSCLAGLLSRHAKTLKKLKLVGIKGIPEPRKDEEETDLDAVFQAGGADMNHVTTWQEVFELIHDSLTSLVEVTISEKFTSPAGGRRIWFAQDGYGINLNMPPSRMVLLHAEPLEKYLLGKGKMPEINFEADDET